MSKKIGGSLPTLPKSEIDGKVDLSKQSLIQLQEIYNRQTKLLANKGFIKKLPDKGERIGKYSEKVQEEINKRSAEEQTCRLFDRLNINSVSKEAVENVEWEGKIKERNDTYLDSDDDSEPEDVLGILSQVPVHRTKVIPKVEEKSLITEADLEDIKELTNDFHTKYIVEMTEHNPDKKLERQFKPYQTTICNSLDPSKEMGRHRGPNWEVTAATHPPSIHGPVKQIAIEESLKLQQEHQEKLNHVLQEHAFARLLRHSDLPHSWNDYRQPDEIASSNEAEDSHDSEDERGGVNFTISS